MKQGFDPRRPRQWRRFSGQCLIAGHFSDQERVAFFEQAKSGPKASDFTGPQAVTVEPEGIQYEGNVVVLTNRSCYSATNSFVAMLKGFPQVTLMGDTTKAVDCLFMENFPMAGPSGTLPPAPSLPTDILWRSESRRTSPWISILPSYCRERTPTSRQRSITSNNRHPEPLEPCNSTLVYKVHFSYFSHKFTADQ